MKSWLFSKVVLTQPQSPDPPKYIRSFLTFIYWLYVNVVSACISVRHVYALLVEVRRGVRASGDWNYLQL